MNPSYISPQSPSCDWSAACYPAAPADFLPTQPDHISPFSTKLIGIVLALLARRTIWGTLESVVWTGWLFQTGARSAPHQGQFMALRSIWKGTLRFSLVSIPVQAYTAAEPSDGEIHFNQLHDKCH